MLFQVLGTSPELLKDPDHARGFVADRNASVIGLSTTALAALIGYVWSPIVATGLFFALPVFYAIASEGFEGDPPK